MKLDWVHQLSISERELFISFLLDLAGKGPLQHRYLKSMRIIEIYVPIVKHGGKLPVSINFTALVEDCGANLGEMRIELLNLYTDFSNAHHREQCRRNHGRLLDSRQAAELTGLSPRKIIKLARANQIKGAIKRGRYWRFLEVELLTRAKKMPSK
ncbi:MAG: hypothetical protein C3F02_01335 [Parcubacteria group bacterium]|nr:MAG: hypothetical protein C3F02_01335 [Parcubacteria group bacterium]